MVTAHTDLGYDVGPCEELLVYFDASSPGGASEVKSGSTGIYKFLILIFRTKI